MVKGESGATDKTDAKEEAVKSERFKSGKSRLLVIACGLNLFVSLLVSATFPYVNYSCLVYKRSSKISVK
jgi:hypothetical protein